MSTHLFSHALLFDTNLFDKITKNGNESCFEALFRSLNEIENPNNEINGFLNCFTPFLLLEYLGQTPPNIPYADAFEESLIELGAEMPPEIYNRAIDLYQKQDCLSETALRERNKKNLEYVSSKAQKLYNDIVSRVVDNNGFTNLLIQNLALDFTYRFPYPQHLSGDDIARVHINTILDVFRAHSEKVNLTQMRGVLKLCEQLRSLNKGKQISEGAKQLFEYAKGVKEFRDLVDLDIIQLSSLGAFIGDKKYRIYSLTCDPEESIIGRLTLFKSTFRYFENEIKEKGLIKKGDPLDHVEVLEGKIAIVDQTSCTITKVISVSDIGTIE
ncbi:MAG: hypothetical protein H6620_12410 [Halobacteriovoraceae bacterium]|nr:hypothetical protein [Halobacteriovoraceae bacterium]